MKIPPAGDARDYWVLEMRQRCLTSLSERKEVYATYRDYFLYGSGGGQRARFNKIRPQLETLNSFIYSAETTRFSVNCGASLNKAEKRLALSQIPALQRGLNDSWIDSNADQVFRLGVLWASVYNSMFIKLVVRDGKTFPYLVEPSCFGVLREDKPYLDQQECFVHKYYITKSELATHLVVHPQKEAILKKLVASPPQVQNELSERVNRMLISQIGPTTMQGMAGNPWDWDVLSPYAARVEEDVIEMTDLWVRDDEAQDYRLFTIADGGEPIKIYDNTSEQFFLKNEHPFIQICPDPVPDYFWGFSDVEKLAGLQDMYSTRIEQIVEIMNRQAAPPHAGRGISDEENFAASLAKGFVAMDDNGNLIELTPEVPTDLFSELDRITEMFADALGISNVLSGKGESGVRSKGHAAELARLGSARIKQRALVIEDSLEKMAGLSLKLKQKYDKTHYSSTDDVEFIAQQFTDDHFVKVDAHSNSPIFVEDSRALAFDLFKLKVITRERLIQLVEPPMKQQLLEDVKVIEAKEEKAAQLQAQAKAGGQ